MKTLLMVSLLLISQLLEAAEIEVSLDGGTIRPENIRIYRGDTVTWRTRSETHAYFLESYSNDWKPDWITVGEGFSFQLSQNGLFAYRAGWAAGVGGRTSGKPGTIHVLDNRAPEIFIVSPLDGFFLPEPSQFLVQAAVKDQDEVAKVQFFEGNDLVGETDQNPFRVFFVNEGTLGVKPGVYTFTAKLVKKNGEVVTSNPVRVEVDSKNHLSHPVVLPGGEILLLFSHPPGQICIKFSEDFSNWKLPMFGQVFSRSTFVDESAASAPARFYKVDHCP